MATGVDPVVGLGQLLTVFVGATAASMVAPHLVVLIAGMAGGVLGLMSYRKAGVWRGLGYVLGMGLMAWLLAGWLADLLIKQGLTDDKLAVTPVAIVIGWVGHRWPVLLRGSVMATADQLKGLLSKLTGAK